MFAPVHYAKAIDNEKNRQAITIVKKKREKEWERKLREMLKKEEAKEIFSRELKRVISQ